MLPPIVVSGTIKGHFCIFVHTGWTLLNGSVNQFGVDRSLLPTD
ncbi:MAG TPA: hypothetical protein VGI04_11575 [Neobacillus sp.]